MGIVGRYVDALTDVQRDRVIEAQVWGPDFVSGDDPSCRSLVGHAEDWRRDWDGIAWPRDPVDGGCGKVRCTPGGISVFIQFPFLCKRFDSHRIIRLCKARASAGVYVSKAVSVALAEDRSRFGRISDFDGREYGANS